MEINNPIATMVKIVPTAAVDSSKKLSGMIESFFCKNNNFLVS